MRTTAPLLVLSILIASCASSGSSPVPGNPASALATRYQELAIQQTPPTWRSKSVWEFAAPDAEGKPGSSIVFEVTDSPANTCISGDWRKLSILRETKVETSNPAYLVEGRNLLILLNTELCDAYDELKGELDESGFTGIRHFYGLTGGSVQGKVTGKPLPVDTP